MLGGSGPSSLAAALLIRQAIDLGWLPDNYKVAMFYAGPTISERVLGNFLFREISLQGIFENEMYRCRQIVDLIDEEIIDYTVPLSVVRDFVRFDLTELGEEYRNSDEATKEEIIERESIRLQDYREQWFADHDSFKLGEFKQFHQTYKGAGGAGTGADGKHHFDPVLSMELFYDMIPQYGFERNKKHVLEILINKAERDLIEIGEMDAPYSPIGENREIVEEIRQRHLEKGVDLVVRRTRHVGTHKLPEMIFNLMNYIQGEGNNFNIYPWTNIENVVVTNGVAKGVVTREMINGSNTFYAKDMIGLGFGRKFAEKTVKEPDRKNFFSKLLVDVHPRDTLFGGRVVFPAEFTKQNSKILYEGIKITYLHNGTFLRSFCPCEAGNSAVAAEYYFNEQCAVNGHSGARGAPDVANSAFVLNVRYDDIEQHHPGQFKDSAQFVSHLATKISTYSPDGQLEFGKPLVMRLKDIIDDSPTNGPEGIDQTLLDTIEPEFTFGDIREALSPDEYGEYGWVIELLKQGITQFSQEEIYSEELIERGIYVLPEFKAGRNHKMIYNNSGQHVKGVKNLQLYGDFSGLSGNVIGAMVTGYNAVIQSLFGLDPRELLREIYKIDNVTDGLVEKQEKYLDGKKPLLPQEVLARYHQKCRTT